MDQMRVYSNISRWQDGDVVLLRTTLNTAVRYKTEEDGIGRWGVRSRDGVFLGIEYDTHIGHNDPKLILREGQAAA